MISPYGIWTNGTYHAHELHIACATMRPVCKILIEKWDGYIITGMSVLPALPPIDPCHHLLGHFQVWPGNGVSCCPTIGCA